MALFLGSNYLVTVHVEPIRAIATAERLWREWTDLASRGTGLLAYLLLDAVVDDYLPLLDGISDRIDELEDQIFEEIKPEALRELFVIKKQLLFLRRAVTPLAGCVQYVASPRAAGIFARDDRLLSGCLRSSDPRR